MEIKIKSVTSHTNFEATDNGIVMSGNYEKNQSEDNRLTRLYASCQHTQEGGMNFAGEINVNLQGQQLRYSYSNVADDDFDTIRAITKAVVAAASQAGSSVDTSSN